ncbi:hypothetical protein QL285_030752 [Trifolium repens]|nr:hypothetical protein QL285_030752 [Trifolium repens]
MDKMSVGDRWVSNYLAKSYDFAIKLTGKKEFHLQLKNNITGLQELKNKIEYMYAFMFGKQIKVENVSYFESYIDLAGYSVGFDDAEVKFHLKELVFDDDVGFMFHTIEADPLPIRMVCTLGKV